MRFALVAVAAALTFFGIPASASASAITPVTKFYGTDSLEWAKWWTVPGASHALLIVHGGAWDGGAPDPWYPYADRLANQYGITTVVMEYPKTAAGGRWHAEHAAITTLAAQVRATAPKFVMAGESAGGQMVALLAHSRAIRVAGVIAVSAPHDLLLEYAGNPLLEGKVDSYLGVGPTDPAWASTIEDFSPTTHVAAGGPPTLLFHAPTDVVVPYASSIEMAARLAAAGVPYEFDVVETVTYTAQSPAFLASSHGIEMLPFVYDNIGRWVNAL